VRTNPVRTAGGWVRGERDEPTPHGDKGPVRPARPATGAVACVGLIAATVTRIALLAVPVMSQPAAVSTDQQARSVAVI